MNLWTEELGTTEIDEKEWFARLAQVGDIDELPLDSGDEDAEVDEDEDDSARLRGPPSSTLMVAKTLEDTEVARVVLPEGSRELPEGYQTDPERMRANVRTVTFIDFDWQGIEGAFSSRYFDPYGRSLPRS